MKVSTCHALAMRLMGASFAGDADGPRDFDEIVMQAVALLRGDGLTKPVAEALGVPIDMANETMPSLWRPREMQGFIRALLADRMLLLTIPDLVAILNAQPHSRWSVQPLWQRH